LLVALLIFAAGAGSLVWFLVLAPARTEANPAPPQAQTGKPFDAGSYLTNLADEGGRRILRAAIELSVTDNKTLQELKDRQTEVRNEILALLRGKRLSELEGEAGMSNAAGELVERINRLLGRQGVLRAFFTDFIIQ
jgi:flagellar basal body-associated protein FliL